MDGANREGGQAAEEDGWRMGGRGWGPERGRRAVTRIATEAEVQKSSTGGQGSSAGQEAEVAGPVRRWRRKGREAHATGRGGRGGRGCGRGCEGRGREQGEVAAQGQIARGSEMAAEPEWRQRRGGEGAREGGARVGAGGGHGRESGRALGQWLTERARAAGMTTTNNGVDAEMQDMQLDEKQEVAGGAAEAEAGGGAKAGGEAEAATAEVAAAAAAKADDRGGAKAAGAQGEWQQTQKAGLNQAAGAALPKWAKELQAEMAAVQEFRTIAAIEPYGAGRITEEDVVTAMTNCKELRDNLDGALLPSGTKHKTFEERLQQVGGLLEGAQVVTGATVRTTGDAVKIVPLTFISSGDETLLAAIMATNKIMLDVWDMHNKDEDGYLKFYDVADTALHRQVDATQSDKLITRLQKMDTEQFGMMMRHVPAMNNKNLNGAVEALGRAAGLRGEIAPQVECVRPKQVRCCRGRTTTLPLAIAASPRCRAPRPYTIHSRPRLSPELTVCPVPHAVPQVRMANGDYDTTAYTGSVMAYFAGEAPRQVALRAEMTVEVKGAAGATLTMMKPFLLREGDYKVLDEQACFGCGAVLTRTKGVHIHGCGREAREGKDLKRKLFEEQKEAKSGMYDHVARLEDNIREDVRKGAAWVKKAKKLRTHVCTDWVAGGLTYKPCSKSNCGLKPCVLIRAKVEYAMPPMYRR